MSTEYTESSYSQATDDTNETGEETVSATEESAYSATENTEENQTNETQESEKPTEEEEIKESEPEPEPEPELDPLEGIVYEDDPDAKIDAYNDKFYWEARYVMDGECFEWYQDAEVFKDTLNELVDKEGNVLIVGNGTSKMPAIVTDNGCESCTAIDYAKSAVKRMRAANKELENIKISQMDVRDMQFEEGEFQAVIDKACLDTLLYSGDADVNQMLSEISRVLKKRGVYICISCHGPEEIKPYLDNPAELLLEVEAVKEFPKPLPSDTPHYCYIVRKVGKLLT